jgi:hypothetical protein
VDRAVVAGALVVWAERFGHSLVERLDEMNYYYQLVFVVICSCMDQSDQMIG